MSESTRVAIGFAYAFVICFLCVFGLRMLFVRRDGDAVHVQESQVTDGISISQLDVESGEAAPVNGELRTPQSKLLAAGAGDEVEQQAMLREVLFVTQEDNLRNDDNCNVTSVRQRFATTEIAVPGLELPIITPPPSDTQPSQDSKGLAFSQESKGAVLSLITYKNQLISSSYDHSISVWDADTHVHVATLEGHTGCVQCLTIYNDKIFSGSSDSTIRVWDGITRAHVGTLQGHTDSVNCLAIHQDKLLSGSDDKTIRVWNADTHAPVLLRSILRVNSGFVKCLAVHNNKIFSVHGYHTVRVWNAHTHANEATLKGHTDDVSCLAIYKNKLFSGSWDYTIRVWNEDTHAYVATLEGHTDWVNCLTIYKNKLFSGDYNGTIRVWDADTHAHVATLEEHTDWVSCFTIYKNKLLSGSGDNTIRVWAIDYEDKPKQSIETTESEQER